MTDWYNITGTIAEIVTALAALFAAAAALPGIYAWKNEMTTKNEYDLAKRYLRAIYKVRDALAIVRNPFISIGEMDEALKKQGIENRDTVDNQITTRAVYSTRWQYVVEALSDLDLALREAEIIWDKQAIDVEKQFDKIIREFRGSLFMFLNGNRSNATFTDVIYDTGEDNLLNKEIEKAILVIKKYLEPYLRLKKQKRWFYRA